MKKYIPYFIIIPIFLLATYSSIVIYLYNDKNRQLQLYKQQQIHSLESKYQLVIASHIKVADAIFTTLINKPSILSLFSQAKDADSNEKSMIRRALYELLVQDYNSLEQSIGIKQLHFHLPNNDSFLRMHRPDRYGDNLSSVRESIRLTNQNLTFTLGFEEGRIFNGFRYVFPLFYHNEHIGSVELSVSFTALKQLLDQVFPNHFDFILKSDVVETKVFDNEQSNYIKTLYYKGYSRQKNEIEEAALTYDEEVVASIKKSLQSQLDDALAKERSFVLSHYCSQNQSHCIATFLSITNLKDQHVAYLVSIESDKTLYRVQEKFTFQLLALSAIFIILPLVGYIFFVLKKRKELQIKAQTDYLTGALNRHGCQYHLKSLLQEYKHYDETFSILMFDIDHFKKINDSHGHDVGDIILKELVSLIQANIRQGDSLCRWGGEEFLILLPKTPYEKASQVSQKLLDVVRQYDFTQIQKLTISIGFSEVDIGDLADTVLKKADDALYESKQSGRDKATGKR